MTKLAQLFFLCLLVLPLFSRGEIYLSTGYEYRPERDTEGYFQDRHLQTFSIGYLQRQYLLSVERSSFTVLTGNGSLSVQRDYSNFLLGVSYFPQQESRVTPYLGLFLGQSSETLSSRVENDLSVNRSRPQWLMMQAFGLSYRSKFVWLGLEARLFETTLAQSSVFLGSMARIGLIF